MDHDAEIRSMVADLAGRFPMLPQATVDRLVRRLFTEFQDAPVQNYVSVLVRRAAEETLHRVDHLPPLPTRSSRPGSALRRPA